MFRELALLILISLPCLAQSPDEKKTPSKIEIAQAQFYIAIKNYVETYAPAREVTCIELAEAALSANAAAFENYRKAFTEGYSLPVDKLEEIRRSMLEIARRQAIQVAVEARFKIFKEEQSKAAVASNPPPNKKKQTR